jgi:uncharacterized protein (TIGR03437 family)
MKRANQLLLLGLLAAAAARAQTVSSVRVGLTLVGAKFMVDGQTYNSPQNFLWPQGSKHVVQYLFSADEDGNPSPYQYFDNYVARYTFGGWQVTGGTLFPAGEPIQVVTASPAITEIIGQVTIEHRIYIEFPEAPPDDGACSGAPGDPTQDAPRQGIIYIDGQCLGTSREMWIVEGKHTFNGFAFPGFVFGGWIIESKVPPDPYLTEFQITSTVHIRVVFHYAKRVKFRTNPPGLRLIVDSSLVTTPPPKPTSPLPNTNVDQYCEPDYTRIPGNAPVGFTPLCVGDFDFLPGSTHRIAAPESQMDINGRWWVFNGFAHGAGQNSVYTTDHRTDLVDTITANFVRGVESRIVTNPAGMKIEIDGRSNWPGPGYGFIWGEGHTHTLNAPLEQSDATGRKYRFVGWSDGGDPAHSVTVPIGAVGFAVTANYVLLGQVKVTSTPPGIRLTVDGAPCTTPCTYDRDAGATLALSAPSRVPVNDVSRYDFVSWSGGPDSTSRQVTFTQDVQVVNAEYRGAHLVVTLSNPPDAATFQLSPSSSDGFYPERSEVQVTATARTGFKFLRWGGDASGRFQPARLTVFGPSTVIAEMESAPGIAPAGIRNAAGDTPDDTIAPGSIISIYGENLSSTFEIGPSNPLAQAIGNVWVDVNGRLLPLIFVSPRQINAQMLSDLGDGTYTLTVHQQGKPDVTGTFTIRRNSPGLFYNVIDGGTPLVAALHQDGTPVTPESPARRGEIVTLYGTGFGPYQQRIVDGFVTPVTQLYRLVDPLNVVAGLPETAVSAGQDGTRPAPAVKEATWAGAAPGYVGVAVAQFKIDADAPSAPWLELFVEVNGAESNRVQIPVE